jgi:hypothetical protein
MDFYGTSRSIDMREELRAILFGRMDMTPQGQEIILRRLTDTKCECWDKVTGGTADPNCSFCQGEGYKFYETLETMVLFSGKAPLYLSGYLGTGNFPFSQTGFDDPNKATAVCQYTVFTDYERYVARDDKPLNKLFELKVDDNGRTVYPIVRAGKWKVVNVVPIKGDFGRIEFFVLGLDKEYIG